MSDSEQYTISKELSKALYPESKPTASFQVTERIRGIYTEYSDPSKIRDVEPLSIQEISNEPNLHDAIEVLGLGILNLEKSAQVIMAIGKFEVPAQVLHYLLTLSQFENEIPETIFERIKNGSNEIYGKIDEEIVKEILEIIAESPRILNKTIKGFQTLVDRNSMQVQLFSHRGNTPVLAVLDAKTYQVNKNNNEQVAIFIGSLLGTRLSNELRNLYVKYDLPDGLLGEISSEGSIDIPLQILTSLIHAEDPIKYAELNKESLQKHGLNIQHVVERLISLGIIDYSGKIEAQYVGYPKYVNIYRILKENYQDLLNREAQIVYRQPYLDKNNEYYYAYEDGYDQVSELYNKFYKNPFDINEIDRKIDPNLLQTLLNSGLISRIQNSTRQYQFNRRPILLKITGSTQDTVDAMKLPIEFTDDGRFDYQTTLTLAIGMHIEENGFITYEQIKQIIQDTMYDYQIEAEVELWKYADNFIKNHLWVTNPDVMRNSLITLNPEYQSFVSDFLKLIDKYRKKANYYMHNPALLKRIFQEDKTPFDLLSNKRQSRFRRKMIQLTKD